MRYWIAFLSVPLGLAALAASGAAQDATKSATPERSAEEPALESEPAAERPALQLQLDDVGVEVAPMPPRTVDGYTLEEMEVRVRRAKIGLGASAFSLLVGGILAAGVGLPNITCVEPGDCPNPGWGMPVFVTGVTLAGGGVLGMITTGALLGVRKRKLRRLQPRPPRKRYRPLR